MVDGVKQPPWSARLRPLPTSVCVCGRAKAKLTQTNPGRERWGLTTVPVPEQSGKTANCPALGRAAALHRAHQANLSAGHKRENPQHLGSPSIHTGLALGKREENHSSCKHLWF